MSGNMMKKEIIENASLSEQEKQQMLEELRAPYEAMSDEELLQLVRDFIEEYRREPTRKDLIYDTVLRERFGPWYRMLEKAGTRPVAEGYLNKMQKKAERKARQKEFHRQMREQKAAEAAARSQDQQFQEPKRKTEELEQQLRKTKLKPEPRTASQSMAMKKLKAGAVVRKALETQIPE